MSPKLDVSMSKPELRAFLEEARVGALTTIGRDDYPHTVGMWFVVDGDVLAMWTYAKSQKARNARRDPRCSFMVETGDRYEELRGVLVKGRLEVVTDHGRIEEIGTRLYDRYTLPVTAVALDDGPIVEIRRQAAKRVGLLLPLHDVASWDHRKMGNRR
ncbi:MAG: pyridoxamine 5'-phosphate oxidase family protein [Actinomycetota bacterium]